MSSFLDILNQDLNPSPEIKALKARITINTLKKGAVLNTAIMAFPFFGGNIITDFSLPSFYDNFSKEGLKNEALNATLNQKIQMFQEAI